MKTIIKGEYWFTNDYATVCGYAFCNGRLLKKESLAKYFSNVNCATEFSDKLKMLNGLYSVIINSENFQATAVDSSRTYPLYFTHSNKEWLISNSPYTLLGESNKIDTEAEFEYLATGAPLQGKTLVDGILQNKPGHYAVFEGATARQAPFFSYNTNKHEIKPIEYDILDKTFENTFLRLIESVDKRQIVIPLSGGYDSRIIVTFLKRLNYSNVICYTYGTPDNPDCLLAKQVAYNLGYKIYYINTLENGIKILDDSSFFEYVDFIGAFGNFMWIADYVACNWLINNNKIDTDAVFVPGHLGNFLAGGHLQRIQFNVNADFCEIVKYITDYLQCGGNQFIIEKIRKQIASCYPDDYPPSVFLSFFFQNRKPHIIDNAARLYEFLGHDIRMPFWDKELVTLFQHAPLSQTLNRTLYDTYATEYLFKPYNVNIGVLNPSKKSIRIQLLKDFIKKILPHSVVRFLRKDHSKTGELELISAFCKNSDGKDANEIMLKWYLEKVKNDI